MKHLELMRSAYKISENSQDNRTKVGAIICDKNNNIVSNGCNNPPNGFEDKMVWTLKDGIDNKHLYIVHAEINAISNAKQDLNKCKIYVTLFPCCECAKAIIQSGIKEVYYHQDKFKNKNKYKASKIMFDTCGVKYTKIGSDCVDNYKK